MPDRANKANIDGPLEFSNNLIVLEYLELSEDWFKKIGFNKTHHSSNRPYVMR